MQQEIYFQMKDRRIIKKTDKKVVKLCENFTKFNF